MSLAIGLLFIILACFLAIVLKSQSPAFSLLLTISASVCVIAFIVKNITPYINELHKIFSGSGLGSNYFFTVLKGVAICYVSRFTADTCKDSGQTALSNKAELIGKVGLIALSIPFLKDILDIALSLLK